MAIKSDVKIIAKALQPTEYQIHKAFVQYVRKKYPVFADLLIHIPNEGKRSHKGVSAQKALGFRTGCLDIFFAKPKIMGYIGADRFGLWLEIKSENGKLSASQSAFIFSMTHVGYEARVAYSLEEAIKIFEDYIT